MSQPPLSPAAAYYDRQYNARASVQDASALVALYTERSLPAFSLQGAIRNQPYSP